MSPYETVTIHMSPRHTSYTNDHCQNMQVIHKSPCQTDCFEVIMPNIIFGSQHDKKVVFKGHAKWVIYSHLVKQIS